VCTLRSNSSSLCARKTAQRRSWRLQERAISYAGNTLEYLDTIVRFLRASVVAASSKQCASLVSLPHHVLFHHYPAPCISAQCRRCACDHKFLPQRTNRGNGCNQCRHLLQPPALYPVSPSHCPAPAQLPRVPLLLLCAHSVTARCSQKHTSLRILRNGCSPCLLPPGLHRPPGAPALAQGPGVPRREQGVQNQIIIREPCAETVRSGQQITDPRTSNSGSDRPITRSRRALSVNDRHGHDVSGRRAAPASRGCCAAHLRAGFSGSGCPPLPTMAAAARVRRPLAYCRPR
jgi:hypothetical protein